MVYCIGRELDFCVVFTMKYVNDGFDIVNHQFCDRVPFICETLHQWPVVRKIHIFKSYLVGGYDLIVCKSARKQQNPVIKNLTISGTCHHMQALLAQVRLKFQICGTTSVPPAMRILRGACSQKKQMSNMHLQLHMTTSLFNCTIRIVMFHRIRHDVVNTGSIYIRLSLLDFLLQRVPFSGVCAITTTHEIPDSQAQHATCGIPAVVNISADIIIMHCQAAKQRQAVFANLHLFCVRSVRHEAPPVHPDAALGKPVSLPLASFLIGRT